MGYQLRRMIRDGAPAEWTPLMRLVAAEIADDARDPVIPYDGGEDTWPSTTLPVEGGYDETGEWRDGLTDRTGMSARAISRTLTDLADAEYEMRTAVGMDKYGRPVFAHKGHAMRFGIPPLTPRQQTGRIIPAASWRATVAEACETKLYRWWDEADLLLYIGIAGNLGTRTRSHVRGSSWMEFVARSSVERYSSRSAALDVETAAIKAEHPLFNKRHNDTPEARRRVVEYLTERDRLDLLAPPATPRRRR